MDSDKLSALPQAFLHRMEDMLGMILNLFWQLMNSRVLMGSG